MYGLVLIRYRLPLEEVVKATEEHRAYLRELKAKGILLAAGPWIRAREAHCWCGFPPRARRSR